MTGTSNKTWAPTTKESEIIESLIITEQYNETLTQVANETETLIVEEVVNLRKGTSNKTWAPVSEPVEQPVLTGTSNKT